MSGLPLVSVLLTAYNREAYIGASIESVLGQTFGNFELLITDNRSTDATVEIARDYARRDERIRVVVNEANLGQFGNRNRAAGIARGRFLKYHDSDDLMYPHCLETMLAPLVAEPSAGFALSMGWCWPGGPCPMLLSPRLAYQREFLGPGLFHCGPGSALFRAEVFRALGGFPDRGVGSDFLFWLRACARVPVLLVPADLFWYRIHPGQEYQSPQALREYSLLSAEAWRALASPECPLEREEREQARRNQIFMLVKHTYRDLRGGRWEIVRHRLAHSGLTWRDWLRYLRRPRRHRLAGTPLGPGGDYVLPDWSAFRLPADVPGERRP